MSLQQLVLPGPELETKPNREAEAPLVVRIDGVWPHGSDHRYDLSVLGLEAGYALAVEEQLAAYFIERGREGFESRATPAFEPALEPEEAAP